MSIRPMLLALCLAAVNTLRAAELSFDFADTPLNTAPKDFVSLLEGKGTKGDWKVVEAEMPAALPSLSGQSSRKSIGRVVVQTSREETAGRYPLFVYQGDTYADFKATVRFKVMEGKVEQMAGLAFRVQDEKNYYYVRASMEGTVYFFKVVDGVRSSPIGSRIPMNRGEWYELTIQCTGNQIRTSLNGKEAIPMLTDKTFVAGKIGLWTAADSLSYFAHLKIDYVPREILAQSLVRSALLKYTRVDDIQVFSKLPKDPVIKVIASAKPADLGKVATIVETDVLEKSRIYHSKISKTVTMTLPLHDSNGDTVAAVRIVMQSFPGETEKTAITRAVPIIKLMESRIRNHGDLVN